MALCGQEYQRVGSPYSQATHLTAALRNGRGVRKRLSRDLLFDSGPHSNRLITGLREFLANDSTRLSLWSWMPSTSPTARRSFSALVLCTPAPHKGDLHPSHGGRARGHFARTALRLLFPHMDLRLLLEGLYAHAKNIRDRRGAGRERAFFHPHRRPQHACVRA